MLRRCAGDTSAGAISVSARVAAGGSTVMASALSDRSSGAPGGGYRSGNRQLPFAAGGSAGKLNPNSSEGKPSGRMLTAAARAAEQHRGESLEDQPHLRRLVGKQLRRI